MRLQDNISNNSSGATYFYSRKAKKGEVNWVARKI